MNLEDYDFDRLLGLGYTEKATGDLKDACWKGYTAVGTKKKGGRTVPNCVPIKKSDHAEEMKRKPLIAGPSAGSPSFSEGEEEILDYTRCVRPDGSAYGTSGKCKKGTEQAKKAEDTPDRSASSLLNKAEEYDWSADPDFEELHDLLVEANENEESLHSSSAYEALASGLNAKFPKLKLTGEELEELDEDEEIWDRLDGYAHGNYG